MGVDLSSASNLLRRMYWAIKAGMQFAGKRNLYEVFGYQTQVKFDDLYARFRRQDVAKRVVQEPAKALWTNPPEVMANARFNSAWMELVEKHDLWSKFLRVDQLLCFGQFAVFYLGLKGAPTSAGRTAPGDVLYIQPYGENQVKINRLVSNPNDPRFGRPSAYEISPSTSSAETTTSLTTIQAHYTRVVHFTNELVIDNLYSEPRLENVLNILDDLLKIAGGSAETYWLMANRGMQVDVDKEMDLQPGDAEALSAELEEFQHQLRRYIRTRGVKITTLGSDEADPRGVFEVLISLLAGATGIPQRILMGAEAGQLASEQDRANWATQVNERRVSFAEPYILKPFIQQMVEIGALPEPQNLEFVWPEAFQVSPLEKAQTMAQTARAIVNISRQSQFGHPLVTVKEARVILGLPEEVPDGEKFPSPVEAIPPTFDETSPGTNRTRGGRARPNGEDTEGPPAQGGNGRNERQQSNPSPGTDELAH